MNATARLASPFSRCTGAADHRAAVHGHASLPPGLCPFRSTRPLDPAMWTPRRNTRVDNIFRVYSRQFSRGGVALIAVVHRGFASVPPSSLTPVLAAASSTRLSFPLRSPSPVRARPRPFSAENLFVPRREKRAAVRAATLSALICAQRERRELMHVAHAGRESVGSLSSRTPALTRIHHRAAESTDGRAEDCPPSRSTGTRAASSSRKRPADRVHSSTCNIATSRNYYALIFYVNERTCRV